MYKLVLLILSLYFCQHDVDGANILGIIHMPSKSHHMLAHPLLKTLALQGHNVTMISSFPVKEQIPNYRHIVLEEGARFKESSMTSLLKPTTSKLEVMRDGLTVFRNMNKLLLDNANVIELMQNANFDLLILYSRYSGTLLGLAHHFQAPAILFSTAGAGNLGGRLGNPTPASFVPTSLSLFPSDFSNSFINRLQNTLANIQFRIIEEGFHYFDRQLFAEYFPNATSIDDLFERHVALLMLNTHFSIESVRPSLPSMVQVSGLQIEEPKPLPNSLKQFLDDAQEGVIFLCFGSNVKISTIAADKLKSIVRVLGESKLKVLFKSEIAIANLPTNVRVEKWLPQNDILAHPNVKVFISHGGLLSTTEAVFHGVPILGIPFFSDQQSNVALATSDGYALHLEINDLTYDSLSNALYKILSDKQIRNKVKLLSSMFRDQPMKPLDKAVYWTNYVLRHKGANHLKCAGSRLNFFQYYLIDVALVLILGSVFTLYCLFVVLKYLIKCCKCVFKSKKNKVE